MKNRGITLIALVITIIVLLILAGITISLTIGNQGIITRAQQAARNYKDAEQQEQEELDNFDTEVDDIIIESGITKREPLSGIQPGQISKETKKYNYVDANSNVATIPEGFTVSGIPEEQHINSGLVIYDIPETEVADIDWTSEEGKKSVQEKYNQFVWVPCTVGEYKKHDYNNEDIDDVTKPVQDESESGTADAGWNTRWYRAYKDWKDDEINESKNKKSVEENNGFYIARYEAGVPSNASFYVEASVEGIKNKIYPQNKNDISGDVKPVSKKGVQAWNLIEQANAKTVSEKMYSGEAYGVRSQLVDGTAWDTIITWMSEDSNYSGIEKDSTKYGNYTNNTVEGTRITENNCLWAEHLYKYRISDGGALGWCLGKSYKYGKFTSGWTVNWTDTNGDASTKFNSYDNNLEAYKYDYYVEMATGASNNTKLKNIYDMAGNMAEWTTEYGYHDSIASGTKYAVLRGGSFANSGNGDTVCMRNGNANVVSMVNNGVGFRVVLYIK